MNTAHVIIIGRDLWGRRFEVAVEPPSGAYPMRVCPTHNDALTRAEQIHDATGWAVLDKGAPEVAA